MSNFSFYRKLSSARLLVNVVYPVLCFILLFALSYGPYMMRIEQRIRYAQYQERINRLVAERSQQKIQKFPVRLKIPKINVNAVIQYVGLTPKGDMSVPTNILDVGFFALGPLPGEKGSAVIAGHLDGKNGEEGVFAHLNKLKQGDRLYVEDDKGTTTSFVVRSSRVYNPGNADDVFTRHDKAYLNLITCDGEWDNIKKSYSKRLVVFADIVN